MNNRRTSRQTVVLLIAAVVALGACRPLPHVPLPSAPGPAGAALSVSSGSVARNGSVEVTATGCADDFQYVEVRLVVGSAAERQSVAVTTGRDEPIVVDVPGWTPAGPAAIEASCLEPNLSGASDGADVHRFDYPAVPVTVDPTPAPVARALRAPRMVLDGVLRVSGTECAGRVLVGVARGPWLVASAANFHYGRQLVTAAADGSWSATIPLRYTAGAFSDSAAPGTMTVFAVCEGEWYPAKTFEVMGSAPAVQLVGDDPSLLYLSQCPPENTLSLIGIVERPRGRTSIVVQEQPGTGYGETFVSVAVPGDAVGVTWIAGCNGGFDPVFGYQPVRWSA